MMELDDGSAVVLFIDGLGVNALGPYGNTWFETENLNQFAASSLLFDFAFADSTDLNRSMRSLWHGTHAAASHQRPHLAQLLGENGVTSVLCTDDLDLGNGPLANAFDRVVPIEIAAPNQLATEAHETRLASFLGQVIDIAEQSHGETLLWAHFTGLAGAWDAPFEYRLRTRDEEDPEPPIYLAPDFSNFDSAVDSPDKLLGLQQAVAAQVMLLDELFPLFLEQVDRIMNRPLFCLGSPRGYSMGQHGSVGIANDLHDPQIHVPLMVRLPGEDTRFRSTAIVYPALLYDLFDAATVDPGRLEQLLQRLSIAFPAPEQAAAISVADHAQSIRTAAWKLIQAGDEKQLFVMPDDHWEVNNVYSRCVAIGDQLAEFLNRALADLEQAGPGFEIDLPHELSVGLDS